MALDFSYDTKEAIPAGAAEHYTETKDGDKTVWTLQGKVASATKLDEFRNTNRELMTKTKDYETRFKDVDPAEYVTLKGRSELFDAGKLVGLDKLEERINARIEPLKKEHGEKLTAAETRALQAEARVAEFTIDKAAVDAAIKIGIAKGAQPDIINRVRGVFKMGADGKLVAIKTDGSGKEWYNGNGDMLTPEEFVTKHLAVEAPFLFAANSGSGAAGSQGSGGGAGGTLDGTNPWDPKTFNLSGQMAAFKKNPDEARKMAAKFGKTLPASAT